MNKRLKKMVRFVLIPLLILACVSFILAEVGDTYFGKADSSSDAIKCKGESADTGDCPEHVDTNAKEVSSPNSSEVTAPSNDEEINVIITFTNAVSNHRLQDQFKLTVSSLLRFSSQRLAIHIIGDAESQKLAETIISGNANGAKFRMVHLDVDELANQLADIVSPMQDRFSYKTGAYYNHALFFLSIALHRVMPNEMKRVIMMDADLKFTDDIKILYDQFNNFKDTNIMGIAREMQPVYRHLFWQIRREKEGTRIGEPPPHGLTGFNSGVLLLELDRLRSSELYNRYLNKENLDQLAGEFFFKGHLGDQDFFTLLSMKYEDLFYVLPCVFNRQLCTWWKDHGYKDVFDLYYKCEGNIIIYHGNCKTPIP